MKPSFKHLLLFFLFLSLPGIQPAFALPSITATATTTTSALLLDGEGNTSERIIKVADLAISTDNSTGLSLAVSSGNLTKADGITPIAFQVTTVADGAPAPTSGEFIVPSGSNYTTSTSTAGQADKDLYIKYTPVVLQDPGSYSAAISLIVTDN